MSSYQIQSNVVVMWGLSKKSIGEPPETVLQPITNILLELGFILKGLNTPLSIIDTNTV